MSNRDFETVNAYTLEDAIEDGTIIPLSASRPGGEGVEAIEGMRIKPLHEIGSMDEYLQNYGKILGKKAITSLAPMHVPGRDPLPDFSDLLREPFPCQQHVCAATVRMLNREGSGFIVGEMGTGKTLLGMTGVHLHAGQSRKQGGYGGKYRAIVLAPDHLLAKWEREIKETIPGATVTRFGPRRAHDEEPEAETKRRTKGKKGAKTEAGSKQTLRDFLKLLDSAQPNGRWRKADGPEWFVLGRNQAKWLSDWAGLADETHGFNGVPGKGRSSKTVIVDRITPTDEYGRAMYDKRGKPITQVVTARVHYCPRCGQVIRDKKGVPVAEAALSAKPKGATQKRCAGRFMVSLPDPENPKKRAGDIINPVPGRYGEKKAGDEVNHLGRKWVVKDCNEPLYHYTSRPYRWAPARVLQKKLRRFFQYLVIDEVHEQKSDESAQSMACGKILASVDHVLALTGTIIGGYADHLYPLMMRISPRTLRDEGFEWGKDLPFSETYGRIDRVVTITEEGAGPSVKGNARSMRRAKSGKAQEKKYVRPGVMPTMFGRHLIGTSMFLTLEELADELPDLFEYIGGACPSEAEPTGDPGHDAAEADRHGRMTGGWFDTAVDMEPDQKAEYARVTALLEFANKDLLQRGSMKLLGTYLWTTMDYPDKPFGWGHDPEVKKAFAQAQAELREEKGEAEAASLKLPHTVGYWDKPGVRTIDNWVGVVTPKDCPESRVYPKEQRLIDICLKQKAEGIQTWVYVQMTGKRNVQPRLKKLLEAAGLKVGVLRSKDVDPKEREEWIAAHGREFDVMISHPQLVSTGLDLFSKSQGGHNYATIVFYETGYNLFTMRQAARRAWRIGQPRDCRVYYLYYRETMQHKAMSLMSRKMAAAQALEGEFSEDGLAAMAGEDNAQMALAKNLAGRIDDGDMQRNWGKVKSGPKKRKPGTAVADLTKPPVRTPAPMPPVKALLALTHPQRQAFKRLAAKPPGTYPPSGFGCITDTAEALVATGLAERVGTEYRCHLGAPAVGDVLTWFQLNHADSKVHYPLGIVRARRPGGDDHYVRMTNHRSLENVIEVLPVKGFPLVNSIPIQPDRAAREGWVLVEASESDKAALQANGFFLPVKGSPLDNLPAEFQIVAESLIESQYKPVPAEAAAEFDELAERLAAADQGFDAVTAGLKVVAPEPDLDVTALAANILAADESQAQTNHDVFPMPEPEPVVPDAMLKPEPEPKPKRKRKLRVVDESAGPEGDGMPLLTEDILARMFANMAEHGLL